MLLPRHGVERARDEGRGRVEQFAEQRCLWIAPIWVQDCHRMWQRRRGRLLSRAL
jgi:hypothetical protein